MAATAALALGDILPRAANPFSGHACFPMDNAVMQKQVLAAIALLALLSGCDSWQGETAAPVTPPPLPVKSAALHDLATGEKVYRNTCSICHRVGLKGAPRLGDKKDWMSRLAQGNNVLYDHAIHGYRGKKGNMPARGSNASLSEDEVKAAVDYMVWYSVPKPPGPFGSHAFSAASKQSTIRQPKD